MTLSIIIPTLNEEQTIATTLERLDISANDVEVIIVDGQSTDKTKNFYSTIMSRYWIHPEGDQAR